MTSGDPTAAVSSSWSWRRGGTSIRLLLVLFFSLPHNAANAQADCWGQICVHGSFDPNLLQFGFPPSPGFGPSSLGPTPERSQPFVPFNPGPKVGAELSRGALIAMLLGSLITLAYLAVRFEWRFGLAAVLSTGHDILVTLAFIKLFHFEVSLTVVAAILTLLGYSMNDTIIIFDRVRENIKKGRMDSFYDLLNRSVNETLPRSILTHATTLAATLALLIFAGEVIRPFAWVMFFGIFVATFSSIYVASPLLMWIENKWPRADGKGRPGASVSRNPTASVPSRSARQPAASTR